MTMHDTPRSIALWPLALLAGLLPMVAALAAMALSVQQGLVPACNPFVEGCVSVSRAARHGLPNLVFQVLMVPGATLQALVWLLAARWLQPAQGHAEPGVRLLAPLGVMAAVALVVYATFLGTEGPLYRWLRQYGTVVYFGFTCLCLLLLGRAVLARLAAAAWPLPRWHGHAVVAMAVALPLLGVGNAIVAAFFDDALKARVENVTEWWGSLIFVLGFFLIAAMWRRAGLALQLTQAPRC
jgi:hypothetical protein